MKLTILTFGIAKDIIGSKSIQLDFENEVKVADVKKKLEQEYPAFARLRSLMVAVNNEYANDDNKLKETDEIAIIPPVSGG